ncbi:MAG: biopolymer transporter ExbD [Synergistaceae bacterium]|jgi:biopolymer transport protein ExbD|nr:biopolymer transporter ExbD [Synergistaceae bacterium]
MNGRSKRGVDIDITSLIDVLFMLIIFFVLTASFLQGSIEIDLPEGEAQRISERDPVVVTVTGGAILWAGEAVSRDSLPALVVKAIAESDDILIAGEKSAPYGDVADLLDEMRVLGVESVGLAFGGEKK